MKFVHIRKVTFKLLLVKRRLNNGDNSDNEMNHLLFCDSCYLTFVKFCDPTLTKQYSRQEINSEQQRQRALSTRLSPANFAQITTPYHVLIANGYTNYKCD